MMQWRFVKTLPSDIKGGWYAHYDEKELAVPGWQQCDIRALFREHQIAWLDAYDAWHAHVCRHGAVRSRWWWFTGASRPNVWTQQGVLKPLFFAAAVRMWAQTHPESQRIYLVGCPQEVRWYLREAENDPGQFTDWLVYGLRWCGALLMMVGKLTRQVMSYARWYVIQRSPAQTGRVVFYSHVLSTAHFEEVGDHYFGKMIEVVEEALPGSVLVAYFLHHDEERTQASRILAASNRRFVFVLDFLSWRDLFWVWANAVWTAVRLLRLSQSLPAICIGPMTSRWFGRLYVIDQVMGRPLGAEFAVYQAMKRLLARSGARVVAYPYEEKGFERAVLTACVQASEPIRTLAFAHATHTTCHTALRSRLQAGSSPPQPDVVLATGPRAREFLVEWARKHPDRVVVVGSPRHMPRVKGVPAETPGSRCLRIIVLGGHGYELGMLANMLEHRPDLFGEAEVMIRRYRFGWEEPQDRAIERLVRVSDRIRIDEGSLIDQFAWCDVALFSSTSAGLQAMLYGCPVIYVQLHEQVEADPLLGEDAVFARCATAEELAEALKRLVRLGPPEWERIVQKQRAFAESIFAPIDHRRLLEQLLDGQAVWAHSTASSDDLTFSPTT